jgi:hypothetical protein
MVTYYVGPSARITDRTVEVRCDRQHATYDIGALRDVRSGSSGPDPVGLHCAGMAGAFTIALAASWPYLPSPQAWVVAATFVGAPGVVSPACLRLRPPEWTLYATYRRYEVRLFTSRDAHVFDQVERALLRALESQR